VTEPHDEILQALAQLAEEGRAPTTPGFEARARAALHGAVDTRKALSGWSFHGLLLHPRAARGFGAAIAAAAAVVVALGWSAPAGSPLHAVRLAREAVILDLPGSDRAGRELQFAEDRLADAAAGRDRSASLSEAATLLDSAARDMHGRSGATWDRWSRDEAELRQARGGSPSGGGGDSAAGSGGGTTPSGPAPSAAGSPTSEGGVSPGGSGTSGGGSDSGGSSAESTGTSDGSGGSSGGSGPSREGSTSSSSSSTSSDAAGSSSDGGGSSSSSSSSSDGGGSSGSGGDPSTATTTTTSTTRSSSGQ
jgi:hypothetical protein